MVTNALTSCRLQDIGTVHACDQRVAPPGSTRIQRSRTTSSQSLTGSPPQDHSRHVLPVISQATAGAVFFLKPLAGGASIFSNCYWHVSRTCTRGIQISIKRKIVGGILSAIKQFQRP